MLAIVYSWIIKSNCSVHSACSNHTYAKHKWGKPSLIYMISKTVMAKKKQISFKGIIFPVSLVNKMEIPIKNSEEPNNLVKII